MIEAITNDFQSLFRFLRFKELFERGASFRLDLSDKVGRDLPMGKMVIKANLNDLQGFVEQGGDMECHNIFSQNNYQLVMEVESFQSIERKGITIKKGSCQYGLGIEIKIVAID